MTLGNELKKYTPAGKTQKTVALELAEALKAGVGLQYSPDTAESRWSEALKGKLTGLRFFFDSEPRMETTLRALGVPSSDMTRLRQLIIGAMGGHTVLLDLTSARELSPSVYGGLRTWLLEVESELQVIVGLSDAQYDEAPASFRECGARFERGDLTKLRQTAAIVVSEEPVRPIERWLAISFAATPAFSPGNWRERIADGVALGGLPEPMRPARLIEQPGQSRPDRLPRGPGLRELMLALATGQQNAHLDGIHNGRSLGVRLALGQLLGVEVEATEQEWNEKRFEGMTEIGPEKLPMVLLASRLTGATLKLRVGARIHLVNPTEATKQSMQSPLLSSEDIEVHDKRLDPQLYLQQLREDASRLSPEQVFADPWLDAWIDERCRSDEERLVARDGLVWLAQTRQLVFGGGEVVVDWRQALRALISAVPTQATLLIEGSAEEVYWTRSRAELRGEIEPSQRRAFAPLALSREGGALLWAHEGAKGAESAAGWALQLQRRVSERSAQQRGYVSAVKVDAQLWGQADELLARVLDSLDFNLDGRARVTRDGWTHLLLGGGVVARLQVRRTPSSEASGSFRVSREEYRTSGLTQMIVTHGGSSHFGPYVPVTMRLSGAGLVAELSFSASALLGSTVDSRVASAMAMSD